MDGAEKILFFPSLLHLFTSMKNESSSFTCTSIRTKQGRESQSWEGHVECLSKLAKELQGTAPWTCCQLTAQQVSRQHAETHAVWALS